MRKTTAITLGLLVLLSFLFFMSPVGKYVSGIGSLFRPSPAPPPVTEDGLPFSLPQGFVARLYADDIVGARVITRDPKGALLVSQTSEGKVIALPNLDSDGKADRIQTVIDKLNNPHGLLLLCPSTG